MDSLHQPLNITEYNNLITNIIESAVDELILKRESAGCSLTAAEPFLFHICRLCAREQPQLLDLSELHLVLLGELAIAGIDVSAGCTKICAACAEFLGRIREFRCRCEEAQKRIGALLAERSVLSEFLNLDFGKPDDGGGYGAGGFSPPPDVAVEIGGDVVPELPLVEDFGVSADSSSSSGEEERVEPQPVVARAEPVKKVSVEQKVPAERKKSRMVSDSRRQVVNGKLQWVCLDCERTFESCTKLKKHRQTCELVGTENSKRMGPFTCEICGQTLPTLMGLRVHVHKHSKAGEKEGKKDLEKAGAAGPKSTVCHICGKSFSGTGSLRDLRSHLVFHGQEKRIECQICNKKFHKLFRLKDHMNCHSNERRYSCQVCGKAFFTKAILYKHTRTHDQSFRKHHCTMCSMRFEHPYQLRAHVMIHTSEYPYGCKLCQSKFRFSWDLKKHYAKVHPPAAPEEQPPSPLLPTPIPPIPEDTHLTLPPLVEEVFSQPMLHHPLDPVAVGLLDEDHHQHHHSHLHDHDHDLSVMLADIPPHTQPELIGPSVAAIQPVVTEHPFDTETLLLEEASREFTADCFPNPDALDGSHTAPDDDFYTFMEC
ncbi:zinc finger protein 205-like [Culex pipiens pallens]|uniref:zinc finger protein 205-like n=1 Tax=Culex pipiens pallens TaxID=42434 RepID=UPI0019535A79|nr:zinc finger protein 205-like [Culex pipiens pallens]